MALETGSGLLKGINRHNLMGPINHEYAKSDQPTPSFPLF